MNKLAILILAGLFVVGCASTTDTASEPEAAPAAKEEPMGKKTCTVDADCGEGNICVMPEAADYGFCL